MSGSPGISNTYDAAGMKLKKAGTVTTYYAEGIEYDGGSLKRIQTEEGMARNNAGTYSYEYNLTDHLGNVRVTFYRNPSTGQLERKQSDDYYAFGLRKSVSPVVLDNKYLYNGKEIQDEWGGDYDYGARYYDPVIGRWGTVDPLAENQQAYTPYNYALNNPLKYMDPMGLDTVGVNNMVENNPNVRQFDPENDVIALNAVTVTAQKEPSLAKQFIDNTPVIGKGLSSGDKLVKGDYWGAAGDLGTAFAELATFGFGSEISLGINSASSAVEGAAAKGGKCRRSRLGTENI